MWRRNWPNHGGKGECRYQMPAGTRRWILSLPCKGVAYVLLALVAVAQSQTFATVTIVPARSVNPTDERTQLLPDGDWIATGIPVIRLLSIAYDVPVNPSPRLSSLPDWPERYDIKAQAAANSLSGSISDSELRSRIQRMIRGMLTDRFGLVMKVEQKKMSVYALTAGSGGPKLQKSAIDEKNCAFSTGPEGCHYFAGGFGHPLNGTAINMDDLAHYIENWTDLPVVNRTALSGLFTVNTEGWIPMTLPPPPPNATPAENRFARLPTIFTVLGKLGLELRRQEETVPVYTVAHIERPTVK